MLLCILHSEREYGKILLKQNDKQNPSTIKNFASLLQRMMPFDVAEIEAALHELLENDVLQISGDCLFQKRMVKDGNLSDIRALAGKKGGSKRAMDGLKNTTSSDQFCLSKSASKIEANTAIENEDVNEDKSTAKKIGTGYGEREGNFVSTVLFDYLNRINPTASQYSLDELKGYAEELGEAVCKRAFDIALDNKATKWPYIRAILRDKQSHGVKCLADWDALEQRRSTSENGKERSNAEKDTEAMRRYVSQLHAESGKSNGD